MLQWSGLGTVGCSAASLALTCTMPASQTPPRGESQKCLQTFWPLEARITPSWGPQAAGLPLGRHESPGTSGHQAQWPLAAWTVNRQRHRKHSGAASRKGQWILMDSRMVPPSSAPCMWMCYISTLRLCEQERDLMWRANFPLRAGPGLTSECDLSYSQSHCSVLESPRPCPQRPATSSLGPVFISAGAVWSGIWFEKACNGSETARLEFLIFVLLYPIKSLC